MFGLFGRKRAPASAVINRDSIVPRIKTQSFVSATQTPDTPRTQWPIVDSLVGELVVTYAYDLGPAYGFLFSEALETLSLTRDQLHELAIANFKKGLKIELHAMNGPVSVPRVGEGRESVLLLLGDFWNHIAQLRKSKPIVVVPSREWLLITDARSRENIYTIRKMCADVYKPGDVHALSNQLLEWSDGKWRVFSE
jgi:uncharacterized protein YtpQ (UPF0354 family)